MFKTIYLCSCKKICYFIKPDFGIILFTVLQRNIYVERFILRNWHMWLWTRRNSMTCCLQVETRGSWWYESQSEGRRRWDDSLLYEAEKKREVPSSSVFCSLRVLSKLHDAHSHWGRQSTLQSPLTQMLISSGNSVTDMPRNNV